MGSKFHRISLVGTVDTCANHVRKGHYTAARCSECLERLAQRIVWTGDLQRAAHRAARKTQIPCPWLVSRCSSGPMAIFLRRNWAVESIWKLAENTAQSGPRLVSKLEIRAPAVKLWLFKIESFEVQFW